MADLIANLQAAAGAGGAEGWNISTAEYNPGSAAWNISKAFYTGLNFNFSSQDSDPRGLFFKPDGTKMYITGNDGNDINEYDLSTPWNVSTASYVQNFSVNSQDPTPSDLFFKPDGTKMYVLGDDNNKVYEYSLSTAWNISTASFIQDFSVGAQEANSTGLFFKPDGTKMYVCGFSGDDVNEYSLSTAWDVSTASYVQVFSVAAQETVPQGLSFKPDGTKMYIIGSTGDDINEYNLSTPWDVSTASYVQVFSISGESTEPTGLFFRSDGGVVYMLSGAVYQYAIGGLNITTQEGSPTGISFKSDGTKMYIIGTAGDDVNEYSLSTAWDVNTASYVQVFSVAAQENFPTSLFFKPDGTKMYVLGDTGDDVNEYSLSTAWDVSTASYVQNFSVASQEVSLTGLFIGNDGAKMYVIGRAGDDVNEYTLSTPWDISTASYVQAFLISAQETNPYGVFFKPDGKRMFIAGGNASEILEYSLSTAWNVSTASYVQEISIRNQVDTPQDLFFSNDGTKLFVVSLASDRVFAYTLSS